MPSLSKEKLYTVINENENRFPSGCGRREATSKALWETCGKTALAGFPSEASGLPSSPSATAASTAGRRAKARR